MKTNVIKHHISSSLPHMWVINETRASVPMASQVHVPGYNTFESPTIHSSFCSSKWVVIVAVWRDLHCQHVPGPEGLDGHVLILNNFNIIILTSLAWGFTLNLVAIYALWSANPTPVLEHAYSTLH